MARARHAKPSAFLSWLFPGRAARRRAAAEQERALLLELRYEVDRLRSLGAVVAGEAAAAAVRARRAEEQALAARAEVHDLRAEADGLRTQVGRLREEVLWAWADRRLPSTGAEGEPAQVIDLREASGA